LVYQNAQQLRYVKQTQVRLTTHAFLEPSYNVHATDSELVTVAKIDAFLAEYSAFETFHKHDDGLVDTCRELNVAFQLTAPWVTVGWSTSTTSPTNHQVTPNKMSTEDRVNYHPDSFLNAFPTNCGISPQVLKAITYTPTKG